MKRDIFIFVFMWLVAITIMLSPTLTEKADDASKPWINAALVLVAIPFTLNLIARRGYRQYIRLDDFGVDHRFMFLACGIAYAIASIFISSMGKVKTNVRSFGKDINSTGKSLALLIPAFIAGLVGANIFNEGARYIYRIRTY